MNKYTIIIIIFSLFFHIFGCFYLYDLEGDEGNWLINVKNKILFNKFSLEGIYHVGLSPLNTFLHLFIFKFFKPSIFISRYISIVFSIASLIVFFLFVKKFYGLDIANLSLFIITANAIYNRITTYAYLEPKVYFFVGLTLLFLSSNNQNLKRFSFLPFPFALAFKPNVIYLFIPILLYIYLQEDKKPKFKKFIEALIFILGSILIAGVFFYITYLIDPSKFIHWVIKSHLKNRFFPIKEILKNPFITPIWESLLYFHIRAPVTSFLFVLGLILLVKQKKTSVDKFLLLWICVEIVFYFSQTYVPIRYILDLIFPLSIISAKAVFKLISYFPRLKNKLLILIITIITIIQIGGSLYWFLILKPNRPAKEVESWLIKENYRYKTILAPAHISIGINREILISSNGFTIEELLSNIDVKYPILCILERETAISHKEDDIFLKKKAKFIKRIGSLWIYEIS